MAEDEIEREESSRAARSSGDTAAQTPSLFMMRVLCGYYSYGERCSYGWSPSAPVRELGYCTGREPQCPQHL